MVQAEQSPGPAGAVLALWDPASGRVTVIGRARAAIDVYTPPWARYSLLAWLPAGSGSRGGCLVKITNTATRSVLTVPVPGTLAVQPLRAAAARDRGPDINYTIAVLPPRS